MTRTTQQMSVSISCALVLVVLQVSVLCAGHPCVWPRCHSHDGPWASRYDEDWFPGGANRLRPTQGRTDRDGTGLRSRQGPTDIPFTRLRLFDDERTNQPERRSDARMGTQTERNQPQRNDTEDVIQDYQRNIRMLYRKYKLADPLREPFFGLSLWPE